ncbi:MAG: hypothetical protein OEQ29_16240 [Alphaproteobacteria bacterium]|nr:hypothetical protein [Alphaproteobacteria bacterium]
MSPTAKLRRAWLPICAALVVGFSALGSSAPALGEATQLVRAAPSAHGGRIVIAWAKPVQANAATVGNRVVLIFDRPLKASLAGIAKSMPEVVRRIDVSDDRRALTVVLQQPHRMRLIRRGRLVIVDLQRPAVAKKAPTKKTKPKARKPAHVSAKPPEKTKPVPAVNVGVEYKWTPNLQRLTFMWGAPVKYSVERVGGVVWLKFRRPGRIDMKALNHKLRGADIAVQAKPGSAMLEVFVRAPRSRPIRHHRTANAVVFDVLGKTAPPPPMAKKPAKDKPAKDKPAKGKMVAAKPPIKDAPVKSAPKPTKTDLPQDPPVDIVSPPPGPEISLSKSGGEATLRLQWTRLVPAAVFRRGRYIWLVFGAAAKFDLSLIRRQLEDQVFSIEQVRAPQITVLRMGASLQTGVVVERDGAAWLVTLKSRPAKTRRAIAIEAQPEASGGGRLLLKVANASAPVVIKDPSVGDTISVVPVTTPGLGVATARRYAKFRLLATMQGMVVEGAADGVTMRSDPAAVTVTGYGDLNLSGGPIALKPKKKPPKKAVGMFDFEKWRGGRVNDFPEKFAVQKQLRRHAVSMAGKSKRNARRMALARFLFAHGFAADTLGVLRRVELTDAPLARTAEFRALRGASRFLMDQLKNAGRDLYHASLDGSPEIALWRGAVAARAGKWRAANREFLRAGPIIRRYPPRLRNRFGQLAAEAAMIVGDLQRAKGLIALVRLYQPPPRDVEKLDYLEAVIAAKSGNHTQAVMIWTRLSKNATSRRVRVRATAARIERQLTYGSLDADAAIDELETARYIWRGDPTEYRVNELLGRIYIKAGRTVEGLDALERAGRLNPKLAKARRLRARMQKEFVRMFGKRGAEKMPPLRSLAVFHQFAYLMPAGPDGDKMITALADRLVAVDLLGRASSLLEDQIKKRLTGTERAKVGARLALLRLLDKKPAAAIEALRTSDVESMPPELALQRRRLRARALANVGQTGNALVLLGPDRSREAELLRADIHWKANAWKEAAAAYGRIAGRIPQNATALDDAQSRTVLAWAVTLALGGDGAGLKALRARFGKAMASGPYRATFQVIANEIEAGVPDFQKIAAKVSEVDAYQAFMTVYRRRIATGGLKAVN